MKRIQPEYRKTAWLSILLICGACGNVFAQSETPKKGPDVELKAKGVWATTPDPNLPNVLILGDSISIAYTLKVREHLAGKANVFRPHTPNGKKAENCQGTTLGLTEIDRWLAGRQWDVIHFNWGLHDLKRVKEAGTSRNSTSPDDPYQATVKQYSKNLGALVSRLKATGAKLIFATTTPVVPDSKGPLREIGGPIRYNAAALKIMTAHKIQVNDLFALCEGRLEQIQHPRNVHFNRTGQELQGKKVAEVIEAVLP